MSFRDSTGSRRCSCSSLVTCATQTSRSTAVTGLLHIFFKFIPRSDTINSPSSALWAGPGCTFPSFLHSYLPTDKVSSQTASSSYLPIYISQSSRHFVKTCFDINNKSVSKTASQHRVIMVVIITDMLVHIYVHETDITHQCKIQRNETFRIPAAVDEKYFRTAC
jgi:hypothetical protein